MSYAPPPLRPDIAAATDAFRHGQVVVVRDSQRPERGGVVVAAAAQTSDDIVAFMATHACGLVCVALPHDRIERLGLVATGAPFDLARERLTASVEAKSGVSTGISAADRARTIHVLADVGSRPEELVSPGHVFPAVADPGGVVVHPGWAEVGVDLSRVAGVQPLAATFCRILGEDGEVLQGDALVAFAEDHGLPHITIADLVAHRMASESFVVQLGQSTLPTACGEFMVRAFQNRLTGQQHLALSVGDLRSPEPALVRLHSECLTGDVFTSQRCDCGNQLHEALRRIQAEGRGAVLYLRQEGRGIGLANKVRAYALQDAGRDTVEANVELGFSADLRDYSIAGQMLLALGVRKVRMMTNNPRKVAGVEAQGIEVVERVNIEISPSAENHHYLATKKVKLGHLLEQV
ncbi:MAG: GTP cyclohydrolase II [Deltaproteobacteria bacterium]|nr:MAG: GTP cyclohydrolase II [Deltaproteobacteria bacterium]